MAKALDQELFQYILQLNEAEKKAVLQMLKTFVGARENTVVHTSIEQYNHEIEAAVARVESGDFYTHEEVEQISKDW